MKWFGGFELIYMPQAHNVCFAFSIVFAVLTMQLLLGFTQPDQLVSECRLHPQYQVILLLKSLRKGVKRVKPEFTVV